MDLKPTDHRPDARRTVTVMTAGTIVAVTIFAVAFVVRLLGLVTAADAIATFAVVALLATPVMALVATALELRFSQRSAAVLAVAVIVILAAAAALAFAT